MGGMETGRMGCRLSNSPELPPSWTGPAQALAAICQGPPKTVLYFTRSCWDPRNWCLEQFSARLSVCRWNPAVLWAQLSLFWLFTPSPAWFQPFLWKETVLGPTLASHSRRDDLRGHWLDLAHHASFTHAAWMRHCSRAEWSFRKWLSDVTFPFWGCFTPLLFII